MRRTRFNDGWTVGPTSSPFEGRLGLGGHGDAVTLPHDALLGSARSASASPARSYYPGGAWEYRRTLERPHDGSDTVVFLDFEGVYRDALVLVNDNVVAHQPNGYAGFSIQVDHLLVDGANEIKVEARTHEDSRWYAGAGIYRNVWLLEAERVHFEPDSLDVRTPEIDDDGAAVSVGVTVRNQSTGLSQATLEIEVTDADGEVVARSAAPVTTFPQDTLVARQRLYVRTPRRWSADDPFLYRCRVALRDGDRVLDEEESTFGIRTLSLDPVRGLRINDEPLLLRGACVHHDNGPLGAATIDRAEERRVELLKTAGFNAIRSAHNPLSRAMLSACDRLGVLVMDEAFDMWQQPKSGHDHALHFSEGWERVVEAMVRKDRNHPSVIMYSIGNEIPEAGRPQGTRLGRAVAEKVRSLDDTRFVTEAVTGLLIGGPEMLAEIGQGLVSGGQDGEPASDPGSGGLMARMNQAMTAPSVDTHSAETFSYLDVAGYNYMELRFALDAEAYPNRIMVGSETHPAAIATGWPAVRRHPQVIGDFTWTGWDYLGEVGIGRTLYGEVAARGMAAFNGEFPWRTAWCGDIDITGHRRPQSYFREIVFGLRSDPYIAVQRPEHHGKPVASLPWSWPDVVSSWSWEGFEQAPVTIEVYADADEVELLANGRSLGRQPAGEAHGFCATFEALFEPGTLEAVAWRGACQSGRSELRSATGTVELHTEVDRATVAASPDDLAYVSLALVDAQGVLATHCVRRIEVVVDGPAVLQGLGSANPVTEERFGDSSCATFDGRALAVVRPTGQSGRITVTATAEGCAPRQVLVQAKA